MGEIVKQFRAVYYAGETAEIEVAAPGAAAVSVVFGGSSVNLARQDDGSWRAAIQTDKLAGDVVWTAFARDAAGVATALGHGVFAVRCAGRSKLREVVDAIDEAIRTWGTNPNRSISVGEISIAYKDLDDLLAVRAQYVLRADAEENGRPLTGGPRMLEVCFR